MESILTGASAGTLTHMSPELLDSKLYSYSHDIYSLAILLWELWYGCNVYSDIEYETITTYLLQDAIIKCGERPKFNKRYSPIDSLQSLIKKCWLADPEQRPSADKVSEKLREIYRELYISDIEHEERKVRFNAAYSMIKNPEEISEEDFTQF